MDSRRMRMFIFVIFSFGGLTFISLYDDAVLLNSILPYKNFPSSWKRELLGNPKNNVHTEENPLHLQDEYYGAGCEENPYRKGLQILLHAWNLIAERRNISKSFICFGSMLGSLRNGDIIPLDTDADVCMLRNEYHKLHAEESRRPLDLNDGKIHLLLQRHSPHPSADTPREDCNGKIVRTTTDACSILDPHARLYIHSNIYLDIFMIEDHGDVLWDEYRNVFHAREVLFPLKSCSFLGIPSLCPGDHSKYLTPYYGADFIKPLTICKNGRWTPNIQPKRLTKFFLLILIAFLAGMYSLFPSAINSICHLAYNCVYILNLSTKRYIVSCRV